MRSESEIRAMIGRYKITQANIADADRESHGWFRGSLAMLEWVLSAPSSPASPPDTETQEQKLIRFCRELGITPNRVVSPPLSASVRLRNRLAALRAPVTGDLAVAIADPTKARESLIAVATARIEEVEAALKMVEGDHV